MNKKRVYYFSVNKELSMVETKKDETEKIKTAKSLDYFGILKNAFSMVRHHRYLWYLGILAGGGFSSGFNGGGGGGSPGNIFQENHENDASAASNVPPDTSIDMSQIWSDVLRWMYDNWILIAVIVSVVLILIIVFTILSSMAKAGLVHSIDSLSKNEESSFLGAMRFGWHKWWKVFGAGFLIGLIVFGILILLVVSVILLWFVNPIIAVLVALIALLMFICIAVLSGVVSEYTLRYISLKEGKAIASIKNGFGLMKNKKKETFFIWLVTVGVAMVSGVIILIALLLTGLILFLLGLFFFLLYPIVGIIYVVFAITSFIIAIFILSGFISSLISAYWTLCFKELETI